MTTHDRETAALTLLMNTAAIVIDNGIAYAHDEDAERLASLHREFDGGRAHRRLCIDYGAHGAARVALELHGEQGGEPHTVEVFATSLQGPAEACELKN